MFDVKKLARLLEEIFTRDNENFSPELVAQEIEDRKLEVIFCVSDHREMKSVGHDSNAAIAGKITDGAFESMDFNGNWSEYDISEKNVGKQ